MNINMEIFNIINVKPNESIKIISSDTNNRIKLIRNITHILHVRYKMDIIIVSSSYMKKKNMEYEIIFGTIESFFREINKNKIKFNQNTILVLDNCCDGVRYYEVLTKISKDSKFCNIIFGVSTTWSTFWSIDTDVTFCMRDITSTSIYNKYIDTKTMPLNIFTDVFNESTSDDNALMIDKKNDEVIIKKCVLEKRNTYVDYYKDNFSYDKNVNALYHIYNNFSMYHDINSALYTGLWDNVNFIVKCSYLFFTFGILRENPYDSLYLPRELHTIILHFMIQTYQKNDVKDFNKKNENLIGLIASSRYRKHIAPGRID